jgi:hypothetical protein
MVVEPPAEQGVGPTSTAGDPTGPVGAAGPDEATPPAAEPGEAGSPAGQVVALSGTATADSPGSGRPVWQANVLAAAIAAVVLVLGIVLVNVL